MHPTSRLTDSHAILTISFFFIFIHNICIYSELFWVIFQVHFILKYFFSKFCLLYNLAFRPYHFRSSCAQWPYLSWFFSDFFFQIYLFRIFPRSCSLYNPDFWPCNFRPLLYIIYLLIPDFFRFILLNFFLPENFLSPARFMCYSLSPACHRPPVNTFIMMHWLVISIIRREDALSSSPCVLRMLFTMCLQDAPSSSSWRLSSS